MTKSSSKRVLITGAASGIGLATAKRFAAEDCALGLFDINAEALATAAESLTTNAPVLTFCGSVTDPADIARAVDAMNDKLGGLDVLVTSAGIIKVEPAFDVTLETFRRTLDVNVTGSWLPSQAAARVMAANGGGAIVMIGSVYGASGAPNRTAYCASKGAIHNLVQSFAVEWAPLGIRVNGVAPAGVRTPMVQALIDQGIYNLKGVTARLPLGRLVEAEEVADACYYLSSDRASMVNGHILAVDGGWLANGFTSS